MRKSGRSPDAPFMLLSSAGNFTLTTSQLCKHIDSFISYFLQHSIFKQKIFAFHFTAYSITTMIFNLHFGYCIYHYFSDGTDGFL